MKTYEVILEQGTPFGPGLKTLTVQADLFVADSTAGVSTFVLYKVRQNSEGVLQQIPVFAASANKIVGIIETGSLVGTTDEDQPASESAHSTPEQQEEADNVG